MKLHFFSLSVILILISCKPQETNLNKYVKYEKYSPSKTLTYRFNNNCIEFILPNQYKSKNRYISFFLKDTVSGAYINSHAKYNTNSNIVRIKLNNDLRLTNNLVLSNFFTWDDDFMVFGCCQIMRFYYLISKEGTLVYEPTCKKDTFYTLRRGDFEKDGYSMGDPKLLEFIRNRLTCD
jgi:hypothetical protein